MPFPPRFCNGEAVLVTPPGHPWHDVATGFLKEDAMTFSIDQLVADCVAAAEGEGGHSGVAVEEVLARSLRDASAIEAAIGHPRDLPLLTPWHRSETLTVLHVVWPPTVDLLPHDHLMWAAIGLYGGREDNRVFRSLPDGALEHRRTRTLLGGDTILLGDDAVHAVANPSREWTGAVHVYGGDFFRRGKRMWSDPTTSAMEFDFDLLSSTLADAAERAKVAEGSS